MCQLRGDLDAAVAPRRNRPLPLQRLWPLPQAQQRQPTAGKADKTFGRMIGTEQTNILISVSQPFFVRSSLT